MTATQSITLYTIALKYFKNEADATAFIKEIEIAVDKKFEEKVQILATKQDLSEAKVDIIKWQVGTAIAIIGILLALIKLS